MDRHTAAMIQFECQQLLNRVTMYTDSEQWQQLADCYTEDAELFRPSDANTGILGKPAIYESFTARPPRTSCHMLANSIFDIIDEQTVSASSRIWLMAAAPDDNSPAAANSTIMVGTFEDSLVWQNDTWLIARRKGSLELKYNYEKTCPNP